MLDTAPEAGGSFNTHQPNQVTKNMLVWGGFRAVLSPSALSSLETAGDSHRCLGRMAGPAEDLGHGSAGGLWTPGLLVEAGITARMLRRQAKQAGPGHPSQDMDNATDGWRERKNQASPGPAGDRPLPFSNTHCPSGATGRQTVGTDRRRRPGP